MKGKVWSVSVLTAAALLAQQWQPARPGYRYHFPADHFDHPQYQTEWWYYTGNLHAADGHHYGFELTFFRQAGQADKELVSTIAWRADQFYLAHLALSDLDGNTFYHVERLNRPGPGIAGANQAAAAYWNGNWQVHWLDPASGHQQLSAVTDRLSLTLDLLPEKPPVIHGRDGVSVKGPERGEASHYISFTRLRAAGRLFWKNSALQVEGVAWMDHEFFTEPPDNNLNGWDWFAIQLNNREELMLYRLRRSGERPERFSSGTYINPQGKARFLDSSQFSLTPQEQWHSPDSGQTYPVGWHISVPSLQLELSERTELKQQELFSKDKTSPSYWEGAVRYDGTEQGQSIAGVGYLEMTGYAGAMHLGGSSK